MNFARTFLACLIITMMSMSSWASTSMACMVTDAETSLVVENGSKSPHHEHHGEAAQAPANSIDSEVDLPLESSVNQQFDDYNSDCSCCGGCISLCAASSSGSAALIVSAMDVNFHQPSAFILFASTSHSSPSLASLFRPPATKTL